MISDRVADFRPHSLVRVGGDHLAILERHQRTQRDDVGARLEEMDATVTEEGIDPAGVERKSDWLLPALLPAVPKVPG